ncbi:MAG TPA: hypothetical protein VNL70_10115, partial [Tepidisphaeraceae bacterium]|nr:hypothetical protein [Tepidisphaeraceae bacterium]
MRKVLIYSLLLVLGLIASQFTPAFFHTPIRLLTMLALSFIMIHVGFEFDIDRSQPRKYVWDYFVAFTAAAFPWIFCALYFVYVMSPPQVWGHPDLWKEVLLESRFASPTSAGVLFAMLAAAGLGATWVFRKARILAIFDDLDTILLMIPLKIMMVGMKWQLVVIVIVIILLLWIAWKYLNAWTLPVTWPWVLSYAAAITLISELIHLVSKQVDPLVPVHLEVLLPAFVLGCVLRGPQHVTEPSHLEPEGTEVGPEQPTEQFVSTIVSAAFMVLVGLSMPPILGAAGAEAATTAAADPHAVVKVLDYQDVPPEVLEAKNAFPGWGMIAVHVVLITIISNIGKLFPAFCYRREATWRERLAVAVGMFPRGEVGAGVLVISLSYGIGGPTLLVAILSLALNLLLTGVFILIVKKLIAG